MARQIPRWVGKEALINYTKSAGCPVLGDGCRIVAIRTASFKSSQILAKVVQTPREERFVR
ncbi:MAG: hypothetical protein ACJ77R_13845, partial [Gemmatimonadaceae bacterium]